MSTEIIKLTNPDDNLVVAQDFVKQYKGAIAACESIKTEFEKEFEYVKSLAPTAESLQAIKKQKVDHNKVFEEYDAQRKTIKKAVNAPYDLFNDKYTECVKKIHEQIDAEYKNKISEVTDKLIAEKTESIKAYYDECVAASGIVDNYGEFFGFETVGLKINLSASENKLKEETKAFIDRISDDLKLIETQEHKDEILYEYKKSLNVSGSITVVANRYKAIEAEKAREAERKAKQQAQEMAEKKVEQATVPIPEPLEAPKPISPPTPSEDVVTVKFRVRANMAKIKELKQFLINGGYDFE